MIVYSGTKAWRGRIVGLLRWSRKPVYPKGYREFESLPLRKYFGPNCFVPKYFVKREGEIRSPELSQKAARRWPDKIFHRKFYSRPNPLSANKNYFMPYFVYIIK